MPTVSITIEDTAPVLVYSVSNSGSNDWVVGSSKNDTSTELYSQSSFMVTQLPNANVSFTFYGTGVQIYGAKRSNHGNYQIKIDQTVYSPVSGNAADPGTFQTALFSAPSLNLGVHTVTMTNLGGTTQGSNFLDIDFLTYQTPVGSSDETLQALTCQDSDPSFQYSPSSAWNPSPPNVGMFSGGSGHITTTPEAYVEASSAWTTAMPDIRPAVALFGPVGPNYASYSVELDGGSAQNFTANKAFYRPQQMLFQAGNLGNKQHTLRVTSQAGTNNLTLGIDFAQIFTTGSLQGSVESSSSSSHSLSGGAIAGIILGSLISCLLATILFLILRRNQSYPPKVGKFFRLKGRSDKVPGFVAEAFEYRPLEGTETIISSNAGTRGHMSNQPSQSTLNTIYLNTPTPPSTGLGSTTGGTYASTTNHDLNSVEPLDPHSQVVVMPPFTADGKYRPDLSSSAPQLLPPPRRNGNGTPQVRVQEPGQTAALPVGILRDNRSQVDLRSAASPSPSPFIQPQVQAQTQMQATQNQTTGQPVLTGTGTSGHDRQQQAVLAPVRRGGVGQTAPVPVAPVPAAAPQIQQPAPGLVARHSSGAGSLDFNLSPSLLTMPPPEYQRDPS
ncbi:hypothetical protein CVT26_012839 [Gymnopilus dilepis]|uniref:Uncharacterized protein n=1 Tax=Gymnopilus dilepis TaxID=231916 RepID=A0A409Y479_9AGAR|nr:hypothetical protein CVT26_012839 [Gymnopilus dilepis]